MEEGGGGGANDQLLTPSPLNPEYHFTQSLHTITVMNYTLTKKTFLSKNSGKVEMICHLFPPTTLGLLMGVMSRNRRPLSLKPIFHWGFPYSALAIIPNANDSTYIPFGFLIIKRNILGSVS